MALPQRSSWLAGGIGLVLVLAFVAGLATPGLTPWLRVALIAGGILAVVALLVMLLHLQGEARTSARLRTEAEIAQRRMQLACSLGETAPWEWHPGDDTVWFSAGACDLFGVTEQDAPTRLSDLLGYIHPDDVSGFQQYIDRAREGEAVLEAEFRIRRPDGGVRCVVARGTPAAIDGRRVIEGFLRDGTTLTNARRRLQLAEAQYRFLFEHTPLSMWVFDRDTRQLLAVNDEAIARYGDQPANLQTPLTMLDFSSGDDQPAMREARLYGDREQGRVWTYRRADGTVLQAAIFSQDFRFDHRPARLVAAQDVADQDRSQKLLQMVANATSDAIYEWDIGRNALWLSDSFFSAFRYERPTFPPTMSSWKARIHPSDARRVVKSLVEAVNGDSESWESEYSLQRGDRSYASVLHRGFFLRDREGHATRMVGGLLDLTERRRVATDLRLLRRAVESTNTGIIIAEAPDHGQPIVYVNSAFESITGYSSAEVVGRNCRFLQGEDRDQPGVLAIREAIAEERELRVSLKNFRKDGEPFWNDLHLSPLRDETGVVTHYMGVITDVSERHRYEEQLSYRATHDDLTGLPNRQLVIDRLTHAINAAKRLGGTVTVLFIDLDNFKMVNDTMGHGSGDAVLRTIADRLAKEVRGGDTAGRFGGDEFILVLEDEDAQANVDLVVDRVSNALAAPIDIGGTSHSLTMSIGHCVYPRDGSTADALLLHADIAMYQAKRRGRNRAVAYSPDFDESESTRLQLVARLREALDNDEFSLVFQPLFRSSGRAVALEALIRWNHPQRGELLPGYFIDACEESGLIIEMERSVLAAAGRYHQRLAEAGFGDVRIAVNISSSHFGHDLYRDVETVVRDFHLPPGSLELELTESVIMESPESAIETMGRLASLGVSSTVDDFGTGYSSLAYLKRLPIVRVKIDRAFVRDLGSDLGDRSICESIISLARSMDLTTVAEGVETDFQLGWLREHGIDEFQGYLLGRPAPFDVVVAELARYRDAGRRPQVDPGTRP